MSMGIKTRVRRQMGAWDANTIQWIIGTLTGELGRRAKGHEPAKVVASAITATTKESAEMPMAIHARTWFGLFKRFWSSSSQSNHCGVPSAHPDRAAMTPTSDIKRNSAAYLSRFCSAPSAIPLSEKDLQEFEDLLCSISTPGSEAYYRVNPESLTREAFFKHCVGPLLIAEVRRLKKGAAEKQ